MSSLTRCPAQPDAYVCASDYIAHYIQQYFDERGIPPGGQNPSDRFDNNTEYSNVANRITTVETQTPTIGTPAGLADSVPSGQPHRRL